MANLDKLMATQEAMIGIRNFQPDGNLAAVVEFEWASADYVLDGNVFAWWWIGENPGGHGIKVNRVEDIDYAILLHHDYGAIEISDVYFETDLEKVNDWRSTRDADMIRYYLGLIVEQIVAAPSSSVPTPQATWPFQVMIEWRRLEDDEDRYVVVGAWAANANEIAFVALPMYSPIEAEYVPVADIPPLELFEYYYEDANTYTIMRGKVDPIEASSAIEAAKTAVFAHQNDAFRME